MTMHGKLEDPKAFKTPAPNKYEVIFPVKEVNSFATIILNRLKCHRSRLCLYTLTSDKL